CLRRGEDRAEARPDGAGALYQLVAGSAIRRHLSSGSPGGGAGGPVVVVHAGPHGRSSSASAADVGPQPLPQWPRLRDGLRPDSTAGEDPLLKATGQSGWGRLSTCPTMLSASPNL